MTVKLMRGDCGRELFINWKLLAFVTTEFISEPVVKNDVYADNATRHQSVGRFCVSAVKSRVLNGEWHNKALNNFLGRRRGASVDCGQASGRQGWSDGQCGAPDAAAGSSSNHHPHLRVIRVGRDKAIPQVRCWIELLFGIREPLLSCSVEAICGLQFCYVSVVFNTLIDRRNNMAVLL